VSFHSTRAKRAVTNVKGTYAAAGDTCPECSTHRDAHSDMCAVGASTHKLSGAPRQARHGDKAAN